MKLSTMCDMPQWGNIINNFKINPKRSQGKWNKQYNVAIKKQSAR